MKTVSLEKIKEQLKSDKKMLFVILLGLAGFLLFGVSQMFAESESETYSQTDLSWQTIEENTAKKLEQLLKDVDGVGDVKVYVTLECLTESVYAVNTQSSNDDTSSDFQQEYVLIEQDNDDMGLVIKSLMPVYRGVAINCEGGGSNVVRNEVVNLVCAALGISSNRVYVTKMTK